MIVPRQCVSRYFLLFLFVSFLSENLYAADDISGSVKVIIVDSNNRAFNAEIVRWWFAGQRNTRHQLKCVSDQCNERFLKQTLTGTIVISAHTSIADPEDKACWQLYHGETLFDVPAEEVKIVMHYKNKICK